jgi:putative transposase
VKHAWIAEQGRRLALAERCDAPAVSVSGYRVGKRGGTPDRKRLTDNQMRALIRPSVPNSKGRMVAPARDENFGLAVSRLARNGTSG